MSDSEPQMMVVGGNRGGRPRVDDRRVPIGARVKPMTYDRLCKMALRHDETLSSLVARLLDTKFGPQ